MLTFVTKRITPAFVGAALVVGALFASGSAPPRASADPDCFIGVITNYGPPSLSGPSPTYPTQAITSSGGSWSSCQLPFTGFYKQWIRNGVVIEETWVVGSPNNFTYTVPVADIGVQLRSAVKPCNADGCYDAFVGSSNSITPTNRPPSVPTNLLPGHGLDAENTTPILSATFSDPDGHSGWVAFTITRVEDGVVVATGNGVAVQSGGTSSWTVPDDILDGATEYDWSAFGIDSLGVSSTSSGAVRYRPTRATISYYADSVDMNFWLNAGRALGNDVFSRTLKLKRLFVVLVWGAQTRERGEWGVRTPDDFALPTNAAIKRAAQQFGRGFFEGTHGAHWAHLRIVMATNNSGLIADSGRAGGIQWGLLVNQMNTWFENNGPDDWPFSQQVIAQGANDIESGVLFCNPAGKAERACPETARAWAEGYTDTAQQPFFNIGDCEGCPENRLPQPNDPIGPSGGGWKVSDVWYVSWGVTNAWPAPQIYRTDARQAAQWEAMTEYSDSRPRGHMMFTAVLTQHGSCLEGRCAVGGDLDNLPFRARGQLWRALNLQDDRYGRVPPIGIRQTSRPKFATDIRHNYP